VKSAGLLVAAAAMVLSAPHALTAQDKNGKTNTHYEFIQINRFDVAPGMDFPDTYRTKIDEDLFRALQTIKGIKQVLRDGESLPVAAPVLRIAGTITNFKKGNRAARYVVSFGAGATVIDAHIRCYDARTNQLLFEHDVDGKVVFGMIGGKSDGANNGLAREVAKDVKQKFY